MKVAIVYASTTGNTEALAKAAEEGAKAAGRNVLLTTADCANEDEALAADLLLLGSPAMGAEQLEDSMETFFSGIESKISGKKIALFGSYDWGDGQWLRDWCDRAKNAGADVPATLKAQLSPSAEDLEKAKKLGIL